MSPRPDVSEQRKDQILDAAINVFARLGFHKARMDDIAQEAGLSKGALYWYYKGKDAIIAALLDRIFAWEMKDLEAVRTAEGPVGDRLLDLTHRMAAYMQRLSLLLPIAFEFYAVAARQESVRRALQRYFQTYREAMADLIRQGVERGEFHPVDAEKVAITFIGLFEGLFLLWAVDPQAVDLPQVGEVAVRLLLDGLKAKE